MTKIDDVKKSMVKPVNDVAIREKLDSIEDKESSVEPVEIPEKVEGKDKIKIEEKSTEKVEEGDPKVFTKKEREDTTEKFLSYSQRYGKLRRQERRLIKDAEYDSVSGMVREITVGLAVVGIILVVVLRNFLPNTAMFALLIIIGATSFLPVGMILGWLLFDPIMRCKVLRKMTKRNYGVVNFVGEGTKLFPKIKNFDYSLIWKQNECWVLAKSRIYQMTKDGNALNDGKQIDPGCIVTYVDTVPVLFVDTHSMEPLILSMEGRASVYPAEIGSALKAWVDNQRAKMMAVKKMENTIMLVIIVACVGAVVVSFITMTKVEEMSESITSLKEQLQFVIDNLKQTIPS